MTRLPGPSYDHAWWLSNPALSCAFPRLLLRQESLVVEELHASEEAPRDLNALLTGARDKVHVAVFPAVVRIDDLQAVLTAFSGAARTAGSPWRLRRRAKVALPASLLAIGLEWRTPEGRWSSAMGFAPLPSMPVWRRGPFLALAVWPGTTKRAKGLIGFGDVPTPDLAKREQVLAWSERATRERALPSQPASASWRTVTFVLEPPWAEGLLA